MAPLIHRIKQQAVLDDERPIGQPFLVHIERRRRRQQVRVVDFIIDDEQAGVRGLQQAEPKVGRPDIGLAVVLHQTLQQDTRRKGIRYPCLIQVGDKITTRQIDIIMI